MEEAVQMYIPHCFLKRGKVGDLMEGGNNMLVVKVETTKNRSDEELCSERNPLMCYFSFSSGAQHL